MAKESAPTVAGAAGIEALGHAAQRLSPPGALPPVKSWNPPFCGDIDMRIARDGTWYYGGTPIGRPALVRLFSTILRRDPDGMMLVTPVEKVRIVVEDAPFVAVEMAVDPGPVLRFRTNVDEWVRVDAEHPLSFRPGASDGIKPYLAVRDGLEALVKRALFYDLVEHGEVREQDGESVFGVVSAGTFFAIAPAAALGGPA